MCLFLVLPAARLKEERVAELAKEKGQDPFETFCDIMIANNGVVTAIYFSMSEEDVFRIIQDDLVVVGTDGIIKSMDDKAHPRAFWYISACDQIFCEREPSDDTGSDDTKNDIVNC